MADTGTFEATIQETQPMTVAFQTMQGPYDQMPKGFERLFGWIEPRGHQVTGPPMGVYYNVPTDEEEARYEVWVPIEDAATQFGPDESGLGIKQIESMDVAVTRHVGPYRTVGQTYAQLQQWIPEAGYRIAGPPMEAYLTGPDTAPDQHVTEIYIPVREK